jgi:RNA polymerase sigma factor (sigma-70 family)
LKNDVSRNDGVTIFSETSETLTFNLPDLLFIEADDNYSTVVWKNGHGIEKKLLRVNLKSIESQLNNSFTLRCHRSVVERHPPVPPPHAASAEHGAMVALEHAEVMAALRRLPQRQREVLVLRYYADLSEAGIADALDISRGAVKSHASRGMAALRESLEAAS